MFAKSFNVLCFDFGPLQVKMYLNVQSKHNPANTVHLHAYVLPPKLAILEGWT